MKRVILWLGVGWAMACGRPDRDETPAATGTPIARAQVSTGQVDSAIPIEEALSRFREGLERPSTLRGGAPTREQLVQRFVRALETRDTAALGKMGLGIEEFAWFYYPSSPLSRRPYELAPGLMWFHLQGESNRGASKLLEWRGGKPLRYVGHACGQPRFEGNNRLFPYCALHRVSETGDTVTESLFGLIIERRGSYKFIGYANKL